MSQSLSFTFSLPNGLHARPASHLAEVTRRFRSTITLVNLRTARSANAQSVLGLVGTDTRAGDACRIEISGDDEAPAKTELERFLRDEFPGCDEPLAPEARPAEVLIPRSLRAAGLTHFRTGQIACRGLARGRAVVAGGFAPPPGLESERAGSAAEELDRFQRALAAVQEDYQRRLTNAQRTEAEILRAHLAVLSDPAIAEGVTTAIRSGRTAGQAVADTIAAQRAVLAAAASAYIRERVADLEDVAGRLWEKLAGVPLAVTPVLAEPSIIFAENLTPTQFLELDRQHLHGLVLEHGGLTSHVVILARSFGLPTLTGVTQAAAFGRGIEDAIVDAEVGVVCAELSPAARRYYERQEAKRTELARVADEAAQLDAITADGCRLEVGANLATASEAEAAFARGAEGVGLLRTELLFASRATAPDEDEQYAAYTAVVQAAGGRPVIIRTLDIGGDKPVPFLRFPAEANPFLGYRGVRFYAEHADLIRCQLRAILRASRHGPVKVLVPMITCLEEAHLMRSLLAEAEAELKARGHAPADPVPLGFMLEVPATAFILDELCAVADFFSLGTNDLAQYFSAADRENAKVAALNRPFHPAFLRLLKHLVGGVKSRGGWIGLCGEMAENPAALPLLVGLGLDEISLAPPRIPATKAAIQRLEQERCRELLDSVLVCTTAAEVEQRLASAPAAALPLLAPELVLDDVEAGSKAEVIRAMIDALELAGRTNAAAQVEEAVWAREETYSTGFGDGFAVPHGKTDALSANSIVVARLRTPVDWDALDGAPVDVVILLGIRASDHGRAHMEILARLSRLVTREEFRASLRQQPDAMGVVRLLTEATSPKPVTPSAAA